MNVNLPIYTQFSSISAPSHVVFNWVQQRKMQWKKEREQSTVWYEVMVVEIFVNDLKNRIECDDDGILVNQQTSGKDYCWREAVKAGPLVL